MTDAEAGPLTPTVPTAAELDSGETGAAQGPPVCPFLVAQAGDWRLAVPSREHRCTAFAPPAALAPEKQVRLCLTANHPSCATYLASTAAREARLASLADQTTRWRLSRTTSPIEDPGGIGAVVLGLILDRGRWPAIPAIILVTTLLTLAISGFRPALPAAVVATSTPPATDPPTPRPTAARTPTPSEPATAEPSPTPSPTPTPVAASPTPSPAATFRTYRVRSGDTLSTIASRFGTTVQAIVQLNNLADPNRLSVGQVLLIPS